MTPDLLHAIVAGCLIGGIVWGADQSGLLEGKSKRKRFLIVFVVGFIMMLILNTIWPR